MEFGRERGSAFILSAVLVTVVGGVAAAFHVLALTYYRAASDSMDQELAVRSAESGVAYYLGQVRADVTYFALHPAPQPPVSIGDGTFELESVEADTSGREWTLVVTGRHGQGVYVLEATVGSGRIRIPAGIVVAGTGEPADTVLTLDDAVMGSYDPELGRFDGFSPGDNANIGVNGSLRLSYMSSIHGDVDAMGALAGGVSSISGTLTENAAATVIHDIDPIVMSHFDSSRTANDNAVLGSIFGKQWKPIPGRGGRSHRASSAENYGDLIVSGGTYVVPAGTYRVRKFKVSDNATVVFDTSEGPTTLVYVGQGRGVGTGNNLTVTDHSAVQVDSGGTNNGLLTVLGPDSDFVVSDHSVFGQATNDPDNAGYTQVISLGGDSSSDDIDVVEYSRVYARIYAMAHELAIEDGSTWFGSAIVRTASIVESTFAVDEGSLGSTLADETTVEVLATWCRRSRPERPRNTKLRRGESS